jgi:biotin carboxyl carrier protein
MGVQDGGSGEWLVSTDNGPMRFGAGVTGDDVFVQHKGWGIPMRAMDARKADFGLSKTDSLGQVQTQMPGAVVKILANVGDFVTKGQAVVVVEAMKMENEFKAPHDGTISKVMVTEGQTVDAGAVLLVVEENGEA